MRSAAGGIDGLEAVFDDGSLVADAGLLLAGSVMDRLGLEALIDDTVRLGGSAGAGAWCASEFAAEMGSSTSTEMPPD